MSPPIGPYTPIVRAGPWLDLLGPARPGHRPDGGAAALVDGGHRAQLPPGPGQRWPTAGPARGPTLADVVKTTVFVTDMGDYAAVNEAYVGVLRRPPAGPLGGGRGRAARSGRAVEVEAVGLPCRLTARAAAAR